MSFAQAPDEHQSINALSCDASSIASLMSSLEVIEELMRRIQRDEGLSELPKPCEHFRLMVGAGFAGLIVILLGRLNMSVTEAKQHTIRMMDEAFSEKKWLRAETFKATKLRSAIESMVQACGLNANTTMLDPRTGDPKQCKVMVCVSPVGGMRAGTPTCLRTYSVKERGLPDCTIVDAVCATFAVPGLFKPVDVAEPGGVKSTYVGLGSFNPMIQLLDEAASVFQGDRMACIASVGAEQTNASGECERVAQEMLRRFMSRPGMYFRICVCQGMESVETIDWEKRLDGTKHARAYLRLPDNDIMLNAIIKSTVKHDITIPIVQLHGTVPAASSENHAIKVCPPPSPLFIGREDQLGAVRRCLVGGERQRRVCVLYGLGGVGKTQLALKFVELQENEYQHIFYIDCTSANTIEADLKSIALDKTSGEFANDALTWLARLKESWLMVYNNADDTSVNLRSYFPTCLHGSILVTTRNRGMVNLAHSVDAACHVERMSDTEAQELLSKASGATGAFDKAGADLVKTVGFFPLALVQASAYIRTHACTIEEYLDMYRASRGQILEEYADEVQKLDNYELTVYATWRLSYRQLHPVARQLFDVLAFMHHDHITEDTFRFAALDTQSKQSPLPPTDWERKVEQTTTELLANFTGLADGAWDKAAFFRTVHNLASYSLLTYDPANKSYSIHPLVQQWTRTVAVDPDVTCSCTGFLLALSINFDEKIEDYSYRQMILSHVDSLPDSEKLRPRYAWRLRLVYRDDGKIREDEKLAKAVQEEYVKVFGRHSEHSLTSIANLASTYWKQGRWAEAEELQQEVLEIRKQEWGSEHPVTLQAIGDLAGTYWNQGRWAEAEELEQEVLEIRKRERGSEHPDTLQAMGNLASTYWNQGRWTEAEELQQQVLEIRKREWGSEHPDTLRAMANLAMTYWNQGQWAEAEELQQQVLEIRKREWGSEHPDTLLAMGNLALTYSSQGRWVEAEELEQEVLEIRKREQGSEHPDTLRAMANLAGTYWNQGRWAEAEELEQEVLEIRKREWGSEHPDTLQAMANLAMTYSNQGQWAEAEELQQEVLEIRKREWGSEHPDTLLAMGNLAVTHLNQRRWAEAEELGEEVLEIRRREWGSEHPGTLEAMNNLAWTYSRQGRWAEAEELERVAVETGKRVWGPEHPNTLAAVHSLEIFLSHLSQLEEPEPVILNVVGDEKHTPESSEPPTIKNAQVLKDTRQAPEEEPRRIVNQSLLFSSVIIVFFSWLSYTFLVGARL